MTHLSLAVPVRAQAIRVPHLVNSYRSIERNESKMHYTRAARAVLRGCARRSSHAKGLVARADRLRLTSSPWLGRRRSKNYRSYAIGASRVPFSTRGLGDDEDSLSNEQAIFAELQHCDAMFCSAASRSRWRKDI